MRDILFRGKRIDNDEWVYGSFCMDALEQFNGLCGVDGFIRLYDKTKRKMQSYEVDRETVGQYTGLNDKNGKRIFEGDVVSIEDGEFWVFSFGNCGGVQNVAHEVGYTGFHLSPLSQSAIHNLEYGQRDDPVYYLNAIGLCVIGNIHDNPELLKEGADNG